MPEPSSREVRWWDNPGEVDIPMPDLPRPMRAHGAWGRGSKVNSEGTPRDTVNTEQTFTLKDSGERQQFASGMVRDTNKGKARFDLLMPLGVPYSEQFLTRIAAHMAKGAVKYEPRNWEIADNQDEIDRAKESAFRHFMQWMAGERDEDHAAAVFFNLLVVETTRWKIKNGTKQS